MVYLCISVQLRVRDITTMNLPKLCISMQLRVRDRRRLTYHKEFFYCQNPQLSISTMSCRRHAICETRVVDSIEFRFLPEEKHLYFLI